MALAALVLAPGCYATEGISARGLQGFGTGSHGREILLSDGKTSGVRVEPRTWIRFRRSNGHLTRWVHAKDLRLAEGVLLASGCASRDGWDCARIEVLPMDDIARVEVNDFSLSRTAGGIVLGTGAVVGSMVAEVALIALLEGITFGHLKVNSLGLVEGTIKAVTSEIGKRPPDDHGVSVDPAPDVAQIESARPLFNRDAIRSDWIRLVTTTEVGSADVNPINPITSLCATLRLRNIVELGGGVRMDVLPVDGGGSRLHYVPFFRAGLHLELDARRRFAIPAFVDIGGASGHTHTRFAIGLRVRIHDRINLGLYPYNPTVVSTADGLNSRYTHTNTLELGFAL